MEHADIISNNKLIAEFMGITPSVDQHGVFHSYWEFEQPVNVPLNYHSDWNILMPVAEKIPTLNTKDGKQFFEFEISRCHCRIWSNDGLEIKENAGDTISAVYAAVVYFISWFNQNP